MGTFEHNCYPDDIASVLYKLASEADCADWNCLERITSIYE